MNVYDKWDEQNCDPPRIYEEKEPTGMMPVLRPKRRPPKPADPQVEPRPMVVAEFDLFVEQNYQKLLATVKTIKGLQKEDAEDILHDALMYVRARPEKIDASRNTTSWMRRAIEFEAGRFFRRSFRHLIWWPCEIILACVVAAFVVHL